MTPKRLRQLVQQPQHPVLTDNLQNAVVSCMIETTERWRCIERSVRLDYILDAALHEARAGDRPVSDGEAVSGSTGISFGFVGCISSRQWPVEGGGLACGLPESERGSR